MAKINLSTAYGRAFISFSNGACPQEYEHYGDLRVDATAHASGGITPVLSSRRTVAGLRAAPSAWTVSATGRIYAGEKSRLKDAYDRGVPVNLQVHYGICNDPTDFTDYEDVFLIEHAYVTDYTTTALTATQPSEVALIQETFALTFERSEWLHKPTLVSMDSGGSSPGGVQALALADADNCAFCAPYRRLYAWIQYLPTGTFPTQAAHYYLRWTDDNGETWRLTAILDASHIFTQNAQDSRIMTLGDLIVGFNAYYIFIIEAGNLAEGSTTEVYFPETFSSGIHYAVDIARLGDKIYVLFNDGVITAVNKDKTTELVMSTGIVNPDSFCMLSNGHAMVGVSVSGVGTANFVYECYGHTTRLVQGQIENGFYITNLTATPTDLVLMSTASGSMYAKGPETDTFSLVFTAPGNACITQVVFVSDSVGYLTAELLYRTIDGGATWELVSDYPWATSAWVLFALAADENRAYVGGMDNDGIINPCSTYNNRQGSSTGIIAYTI